MAETEAQTEQAPAAPSMMPKILISGFISIIVIAETLIFFLMVPNADDVAALAEARLIDRVENSLKKDGEEMAEDDPSKIVEYALDEYYVKFTPPGADRDYQVEFRLFGMVKKKDEATLDAVFRAKRGRFKDQMLSEIRNSTTEELNENQLGLIKRRILAISNEILTTTDDKNAVPLLVGVGFESYQVYED